MGSLENGLKLGSSVMHDGNTGLSEDFRRNGGRAWGHNEFFSHGDPLLSRFRGGEMKKLGLSN
jgi:hypothetical protein